MSVFQDGVRLYKEGKYSEAVEKLHTVATAEQGNHKAWNALGVALSKTGDLSQSVICFENALSLDPDNKTYIKNLERSRLKWNSVNLHIPVLTASRKREIPDSPTKNKTKAEDRLSVTERREPHLLDSSLVVSPVITPVRKSVSEPPDSGAGPEKKDGAADLLNRALSLFGQGSYHDMPDLMQESLEYTERALELDPDYFDAWQLKASILTTMGRDNPDLLERALQASEHAITIRPEQASMWFNMAGILESLARYDEAITAYNKSLSYSSDEPMRIGAILMKKGIALEAAGRDTEALQIFESIPVQDRFFGDAMVRKAGFMEKTGNRELVLSSLRTAGMTYLKEDQFEKAVDVFNRLIGYLPDDEEIIYDKGIASIALYEKTHSKNYLEDALASFDSALRIQPENMTYLIQKGRCLIDLGRFEEGLQSLDRALWINPSDGITLMNKGIALYQLSRHEEALKYFDLVSSHYPEDISPWMMKSRIHLERKQYDIALTEIDKALEKSPEDLRAWDLKVVILRASGREDEVRIAEEKVQNMKISVLNNRYM